MTNPEKNIVSRTWTEAALREKNGDINALLEKAGLITSVTIKCKGR